VGPAYEQAFAGPIFIGAVHMSLSASSKYEIGSTLPQIRVPYNRYPSTEEARQAVELLWERWYQAIHQATPKDAKNEGG
jgi:hypothetical protein